MSTTAHPPPRLIIVLGSGPGIGVGVASHFAAQSFSRIALLSRNATRLQQDAATVVAAAKQARGADVEVKTYAVDLTDGGKLEDVLARVVRELGKPEVVVCNAARVAAGRFFEVGEGDILKDFKVRL
jgi:NAD(P)-dependent dehydrogenase (short-subunit alcohol dehydrogenase family)